MKSQREEAKRKLGTLAARKKAADVRRAQYEPQAASDVSLKSDAFKKFDRLKDKVELAEAEAEAMAELHQTGSGDRVEPIPQKDDVAVEAELAALKKRHGK